MTLIIVTRVTPTIRGRLTRWMLQIHPGVFLGTLSARVRDALWGQLLASRAATGACVLVSRANNEQGFTITTFGDVGKTLVDFDGLSLLRAASVGS